MTAQQLGYECEKTIRDFFNKLGIPAWIAGKYNGDVLANNTRIEVKIARPNKRGTWQFCLNKKGHTSTKHADFILLVCADNLGLTQKIFFLPASMFTSSQLTIGKNSKRYPETSLSEIAKFVGSR